MASSRAACLETGTFLVRLARLRLERKSVFQRWLDGEMFPDCCHRIVAFSSKAHTLSLTDSARVHVRELRFDSATAKRAANWSRSTLKGLFLALSSFGQPARTGACCQRQCPLGDRPGPRLREAEITSGLLLIRRQRERVTRSQLGAKKSQRNDLSPVAYLISSLATATVASPYLFSSSSSYVFGSCSGLWTVQFARSS